MSKIMVLRNFKFKFIFIAILILLSTGDLYSQLEKNNLTIGFDINDKISIGLQIPKNIINNRLSDYTIPYKYGIKKDSLSSTTALLVIDTISKNDYMKFVSIQPIDSFKTKYGQLIKFYKCSNYNKYDFYINGIYIIEHNKIVMVSYLSNDLKDFNYYYDIYKTMMKTLEEFESVEILKEIEN